MTKKKVTAPLTYNPGKGRPKEHLAYLNYQEMQALKRLNGNNMEMGPRGLPSFPPADAIGSSSRTPTRSSGPGGGSLSAPVRTAPSSGGGSSSVSRISGGTAGSNMGSYRSSTGGSSSVSRISGGTAGSNMGSYKSSSPGMGSYKSSDSGMRAPAASAAAARNNMGAARASTQGAAPRSISGIGSPADRAIKQAVESKNARDATRTPALKEDRSKTIGAGLSGAFPGVGPQQGSRIKGAIQAVKDLGVAGVPGGPTRVGVPAATIRIATPASAQGFMTAEQKLADVKNTLYSPAALGSLYKDIKTYGIKDLEKRTLAQQQLLGQTIGASQYGGRVYSISPKLGTSGPVDPFSKGIVMHWTVGGQATPPEAQEYNVVIDQNGDIRYQTPFGPEGTMRSTWHTWGKSPLTKQGYSVNNLGIANVGVQPNQAQLDAAAVLGKNWFNPAAPVTTHGYEAGVLRKEGKRKIPGGNARELPEGARLASAFTGKPTSTHKKFREEYFEPSSMDVRIEPAGGPPPKPRPKPEDLMEAYKRKEIYDRIPEGKTIYDRIPEGELPKAPVIGRRIESLYEPMPEGEVSPFRDQRITAGLERAPYEVQRGIVGGGMSFTPPVTGKIYTDRVLSRPDLRPAEELAGITGFRDYDPLTSIKAPPPYDPLSGIRTPGVTAPAPERVFDPIGDLERKIAMIEGYKDYRSPPGVPGVQYPRISEDPTMPGRTVTPSSEQSLYRGQLPAGMSFTPDIPGAQYLRISEDPTMPGRSVIKAPPPYDPLSGIRTPGVTAPAPERVFDPIGDLEQRIFEKSVSLPDVPVGIGRLPSQRIAAGTLTSPYEPERIAAGTLTSPYDPKRIAAGTPTAPYEVQRGIVIDPSTGLSRNIYDVERGISQLPYRPYDINITAPPASPPKEITDRVIEEPSYRPYDINVTEPPASPQTSPEVSEGLGNTKINVDGKTKTISDIVDDYAQPEESQEAIEKIAGLVKAGKTTFTPQEIYEIVQEVRRKAAETETGVATEDGQGSVLPSQEQPGPAQDITLSPEAEQAQEKTRRDAKAARSGAQVLLNATIGAPFGTVVGQGFKYLDAQVQKLVDSYQRAGMEERRVMEEKYPNLIRRAQEMGINSYYGIDKYRDWAEKSGLTFQGGREGGGGISDILMGPTDYAQAPTTPTTPSGSKPENSGPRPEIYYMWDLGIRIPSPGDPNYTQYQKYLIDTAAAQKAMGWA